MIAKTLEKIKRPKRFFDETKKEDIEAYRQFLINRGWGPNCCPFLLEEPHVSIPDMIKDRLIGKFLKV